MNRKEIPPPSLELLLFPASDTEYVHFEQMVLTLPGVPPPECRCS